MDEKTVSADARAQEAAVPEAKQPAPPPRAAGRKRRGTAASGGSKAGNLVLSLLIPVGVIALWQFMASRQLIADGLFPSATMSVEALYEWAFGDIGPGRSGQLLGDVLASAQRVLIGYAIGGVLAIVIGVLAGSFNVMRRLFDPMINALRPISITAWIPLVLIVLGIGNQAAYFLVALATFFPVYVNAYAGARNVDRDLIRAARMLGANRWQILWRVTVPASLPSIVTGLRVGAALAWTCVVVVEILGAQSGVGYTLIQTYQTFHFSYVVAAMAVLGVCGYLTDWLHVVLLERRMKWVIKRAQA